MGMRKPGLIIALSIMFFLLPGIALAEVNNVDNEYDAALEYYNSGKYEEVIKYLKIYVEKKPEPSAYYLLGYALYNLGRYEEADEYFADAYLIDPEFSPGPLLEELKKKAGVAPEKEPAEEVKPAEPEVLPEASPEKPVTEKPKPAPEKPPVKVKPTPVPKAEPPAGVSEFLTGLLADFGMIVLAIPVALYIYFSLCLFLIARRLDVPASWTAWVPLVQVWAFVGSADKPRWWILLLLVPGVNLFVGIYLWICITERLGRNRWLGLLMLLPALNLVFLGLLAFLKKKEQVLPAGPGITGELPEFPDTTGFPEPPDVGLPEGILETTEFPEAPEIKVPEEIPETSDTTEFPEPPDVELPEGILETSEFPEPPEIEIPEEAPEITEPSEFETELPEFPDAGETPEVETPLSMDVIEEALEDEEPVEEDRTGRVSDELSGIGSLFRKTWEIYKKRFLTLILILLVSVVISVIPVGVFIGAGLLLSEAYPSIKSAILIGGGVLGVTIASIALLWGQGAFVFAVSNRSMGIRDAYRRAWQKLWSFIWVLSLLGFVVTGGFLLFVIPGVIFAVWFAFAYFIFATEDQKGMDALIKSKEYVRGRWFDVFLRLVIISVIAVLLGAIPFIGPVLSILFIPFVMLFTYLVYEDLKGIKEILYTPTKGEKCKWVGVGVLGYVVVPIIMAAFAGATITGFIIFFKDKMQSFPQGMPTGKVEVQKTESTVLKGGKTAPSFNPIEPKFLTLAPLYSREGKTPFLKDKKPPLQRLTLKGHKDEVSEVVFTPDGRFLISLSYGDYTIRMWDLSAGSEVQMLRSEKRPTGMDISPDGTVLVTTDVSGVVTLWPLKAAGGLGKPRSLTPVTGLHSRVAVSPNGKLFATASRDRVVTVWSLPEGTMIEKIETHEPMHSVAFSPSGELLAAGSNTNTFTLWDLRGGKGRTYTISGVSGESDISSIAFSPDGKYLATGHMDSSITVWDAENQREIHNFYVPQSSVRAIRFSPDGGVFATANQDNRVRLWNTETAEEIMVLKGHKDSVICIAFSPKSRILASGGDDRNIIVWTYSDVSLPGASK